MPENPFLKHLVKKSIKKRQKNPLENWRKKRENLEWDIKIFFLTQNALLRYYILILKEIKGIILLLHLLWEIRSYFSLFSNASFILSSMSSSTIILITVS
jgi:hypothetical protein